MRRHVIIGRFGEDDKTRVPKARDEVASTLQLVAGRRLDHGIGRALADLKALHLTPSEIGADAARHDKYGALSWYDWSIREWGTKWSGYSYRLVSDALGRFEFMFDTAWSTPDPIWAKLAEEFPTLLFEVVGYDEGSGFAVTGEIRDGENYVECVDATDELYEATYGEPPTRYEDEDEDNDAGDHGSADTDSDAATDDEASSETV